MIIDLSRDSGYSYVMPVRLSSQLFLVLERALGSLRVFKVSEHVWKSLFWRVSNLYSDVGHPRLRVQGGWPFDRRSIWYSVTVYLNVHERSPAFFRGGQDAEEGVW